jgi:hypothetical protein
MVAPPNRSPLMKSVSILLLVAAASAVLLAAQGMQATKSDLLVASVLSPQAWTRACTYAGAAGVQRIEVDSAEMCPSAPPQETQRHARLVR